ncbi:hypothetical protein [Haladaptatus cibarius]|uniref:hypothetical protein n=1 Tax=Haladaptatus cibarius TaxID=453847 RepID=UPI0006785E6E|nr:hypothetical protein [Haladaptatus cibarius]
MSVRSRYESRIARKSVSYYDLVSLLLPVIVVGGFAVSLLTAVPKTIGTMLTGFASSLVVGDAVFKRPPIGRSE